MNLFIIYGFLKLSLLAMKIIFKNKQFTQLACYIKYIRYL